MTQFRGTIHYFDTDLPHLRTVSPLSGR